MDLGYSWVVVPVNLQLSGTMGQSQDRIPEYFSRANLCSSAQYPNSVKAELLQVLFSLLVPCIQVSAGCVYYAVFAAQ